MTIPARRSAVADKRSASVNFSDQFCQFHCGTFAPDWSEEVGVLLHPHFTEDIFGFDYFNASCSKPNSTPFRAMRA